MSTRNKTILSLFIVFHLAATIIWTLPDSYVRQMGMPYVWDYMEDLGLWQEWGLFAPDPSNLNMYVFARVQQSDGTKWEYWLPRLSKMGLLDRYRANRFRAYVENAHVDAWEVLWPDLVRWIAEQDREQTGKHPVRIRLYRTWWNVPPPTADTSKPPKPVWNTYMFFEMGLPNGQRPSPLTLCRRHAFQRQTEGTVKRPSPVTPGFDVFPPILGASGL